ncbi:lactate racemase domain-containing protein [uncultured Gimesia sp.]|uniref:lactate racemase domain-containing protein n=1 Tax=uncultured Gimesia sp. TaxID=1678688 RepID=UPI0030D90028|tara:strand:+ start:119254 stop:120498 length:1245 start_codon:yes stop_codon:yes gene_type:complete
MENPHQTLSEQDVIQWFESNLPVEDYRNKSILLIIPDATRTAPLPLLFSTFHRLLSPVVKRIDVLVALGTHPPMPEADICRLLGISESARQAEYKDVGLYNHEWDNPDRLIEIGTLTKQETSEISSGLLEMEVPVTINARIKDYDILQVMGPVFPHEVVGFSGGSKYFFPGISGPDLLNFFHWLGALITNVGIIGVKSTPVRDVVNRSASMIPNEKRCITFVVAPDSSLYGLFYGTPETAWESAADLSGQIHIKRMPRPFKQVLSCAPLMYDELWVAGKCMYKLEPVVADGGELIIYAPHMKEISITHGKLIEEVGYHVRDYFTKQWDQFKEYPWGILAHSTHVRGTGTFEDGVEHPRVQVTLASQIPPELCQKINLGYRDPDSIDIESFANREEEGILLVRKAGEHLYRLEDE